MNILITGCTGFVGSFLVNYLKKDYNVYCVSTSSNCNNNLHHAADLGNDCLDELLDLDSVDIVVHSAGSFGNNLNFNKLINDNLLTTKNIMEFGMRRGIKKFIYLSTGGVYGYRENAIKESNKVRPINDYALSKYYAELLLSFFCPNTIKLRLFFPYGPFQKKGLFPMLANKIMAGETISIYNEGNPVINPIYIDDLVKLIEKVINSDIKRGAYNIGGIQNISVYELSKIIGKILGKKVSFAFEKNRVIKNLYCAPSKIYEILNIYPQISLNEGIKKFIASVVNESTFSSI